MYIMVWRCLRDIECHQGPILALQCSSDGDYILSGGQDKVIVLTKPSPEGKILQRYSGHNWDILDIKVSHDNSKFISGGVDKCWFLWDVAEGRIIRKYYGHEQKITCMQINEQGNIVLTGSYDTTVKIWDMKSSSRTPIQILSDAKDSISHIEIHIPSHELIISSIDGHIRRYDIRKCVLDDYCLSIPITNLAALPAPINAKTSQMVLLSSLDSTIRLFELTDLNGSLLKEYKGHKNETLKCKTAVLSDEKHIVSGSEDGNIVMWNILSSTPIEKMKSNRNVAICNVVTHPTLDRLISASMDGIVYVWENL